MKIRLNVSALIADLGGAAAVARVVGTARTAPYSWAKRGYVGSPVLEKIKAAHPDIDLDHYFEEEADDQDKARRSA